MMMVVVIMMIIIIVNVQTLKSGKRQERSLYCSGLMVNYDGSRNNGDNNSTKVRRGTCKDPVYFLCLVTPPKAPKPSQRRSRIHELNRS